ncbi:MAG: hypothetical protein ACOYOA_03985 [Saprospiraceae bacterium]
MKYIFFYAFFLCFPMLLSAQAIKSRLEGSVSYTSNKNVYVRFYSTENISVGDTLFVQKESTWIPALKIKQKSSTSCVAENFTVNTITQGQSISFFKTQTKDVQSKPESVAPQIHVQPAVTLDSLPVVEATKRISRKQILSGRLTFSTNASINPENSNNFQRIRAAFSLNIQNINKSAFSTQTYLTYRHRYGIDQTNLGFYDDFKVFTLAVQYAPSDKYNISFGRKINNNIANLGAIDGLHGEYNYKKFIFGLFGGTRPDLVDFRFNAKLPQFGAYIVRNDDTKKGSMQTSVAIAEQQYDFKTDRRFVYIQHNNNIVKNLNLFLSTELDLYKKLNGITSVQPSLTSVYASMRYRIFKNLNVSGSYDNRRNVIYYESYPNLVDMLLAQETRQGFRVQVNYNPIKTVSLNTSAFFRFQGTNPIPTKNYVGNLNFNKIPGINGSASISANLLESYYFNGTILGGRISENFLKGKLSTELNYRNVNYKFFNNESSLKQHIAGLNFNFNLLKKTSVMLSYEGTFEAKNTYHRYFVTLTQRFKN